MPTAFAARRKQTDLARACNPLHTGNHLAKLPGLRSRFPSHMARPLEGIRVLDLSRVLAGPFAGRMLCDLGADVVKVEPPDGDMTRLWGAVIGGVPGYFHQQNAGKRGMCIDLGRAEGVAIARDLAQVADVVIENFRPGVLARLGLGYQTLKGLREDIILLSISGFGQDGPESGRAAYAAAIHAETGLVHRQGRDGREPADIKMSVADTNASLHGLVAVLSALLMRARTGLGQHIDIAMVDAMLATDDQLQYYLEDSHATAPALSDIWRTGVGSILTAGDFRHIWRQLNGRMGVADPTPAGAPLADKIRLRRQAATEFFASLASMDEVHDAMRRMNLAWGLVRDARDARESPTVRHRGAIVDADDRAGGTRPLTQSPYRFSAAESGVRGVAPHRGEHNAHVLRDWLKLGDAAVARAQASGALLSEAAPDAS